MSKLALAYFNQRILRGNVGRKARFPGPSLILFIG